MLFTGHKGRSLSQKLASFFRWFAGSTCMTQLKKYCDLSTSFKSKSPLFGTGGNTRLGYDSWKLWSNCIKNKIMSTKQMRLCN